MSLWDVVVDLNDNNEIPIEKVNDLAAELEGDGAAYVAPVSDNKYSRSRLDVKYLAKEPADFYWNMRHIGITAANYGLKTDSWMRDAALLFESPKPVDNDTFITHLGNAKKRFLEIDEFTKCHTNPNIHNLDLGWVSEQLKRDPVYPWGIILYEVFRQPWIYDTATIGIEATMPLRIRTLQAPPDTGRILKSIEKRPRRSRLNKVGEVR